MSEDYRRLFGRHPDTWSCYQVAVSGALRGLWMGSWNSALTGISRLFSSDDGSVLKQVKLTGQHPGPLSPNRLQGNLPEWGGTSRLPNFEASSWNCITHIREQNSMFSQWYICKHTVNSCAYKYRWSHCLFGLRKMANFPWNQKNLLEIFSMESNAVYKNCKVCQKYKYCWCGR